MTEKEVPLVRTPVSLGDYLSAVEAAWPRIEEETPCTRETCSVLYAQYWIETGGKSCFNFNLGNVKHVDRDGFDYYCLRGVWEGVTPAEANQLVSRGEATLDPSLSHNASIGDGKVAVVFNPPHPQTRFRAYASLEDGMEEHLRFLKRRFAEAWKHVIRGDYLNVAYALKAHGYFTASPSAYAAGMRPGFDRAMAFDPTTGPDISTAQGLQTALDQLGFDVGPADGIVGPRTLTAVRAFQDARGLLADGIVGPITRAAIANALSAMKRST